VQQGIRTVGSSMTKNK